METITVGSGSGVLSPTVDQTLSVTGHGQVTTSAFSTATAGETLLAFVGSDGPSAAGQQSMTISGAGLTWSLVQRSNTQYGDAEIWSARAASALSGVTVTSTPSQSGYDQQLTVVSFEGSSGLGASAAAGALSGAPSISLTATAAGSLVYAVGSDYDNAIGRTLGTGQSFVSQWVDSGNGDTFWVQDETAPTATTSQSVTVNDSAPAGDRWDLAAVEIVPTGTTDTTPPTVSLTNPTAGETVSGTIPVAASASDNVAVASVQFFLDGQPLGNPVTAPPYAVSWNTTTVPNGNHNLGTRATDTSGNVGTAVNVTVTVQNPAPPMTCFVMQADVTVHQAATSATATSPTFHTAMAGETLLAFVSADGPTGSGTQTATVSGAGLTWKLVKRANSQSGDAEVWTATASSVLTSATVKSTLARSGFSQDLTVIAMEGTDGVGASAAASAATGAPSVKLTTTGSTSLVFAVGHDWDRAVARSLPAGWVLLDQWLSTSTGDTYWSQYTNTPIPAAGTVVTVSDTSPTNDQWNLVAIELTDDGG